MVYCCVCGLNVGGIYYPETFDLDDEEIAELYDKESLPEWQLKVSIRMRAPLLRECKLIQPSGLRADFVSSTTHLSSKQILETIFGYY